MEIDGDVDIDRDIDSDRDTAGECKAVLCRVFLKIVRRIIMFGRNKFNDGLRLIE